MLTFKCDLCGQEWPVEELSSSNPFNRWGYGERQTLINRNDQPCYLCAQKIEDARKKAAEEAEKATITQITGKPPVKPKKTEPKPDEDLTPVKVVWLDEKKEEQKTWVANIHTEPAI